MTEEVVSEEFVDEVEIPEYSDDVLYDMSDEDLEKAFEAAKAGLTNDDNSSDENKTATEDTVEFDESATAEQSTAVDSDDNVTIETDEVTNETQPEQTPEVTEVVEEKPQVVTKRKYKANGQEFEFTEEEIFNEFGKVFGQAMDYTKKMQAIAPYKSMIATAKEQGLTQEDLNLAIEVLKGDKNAIASVLKRTGVDALDLDVDGNDTYQPKNYGRDDTSLRIQEIYEDISKDPEYQVTYHVVEKQWDDKSRVEFKRNPDLIKGLHIDVKTGVYDKVSPMAMKLKILDGSRLSDVDYYIEAGKQYYGQLAASEQQAKAEAETRVKAEKEATNKANEDKIRLEKAKVEAQKRNDVQASADKRKAAAPTTSRADKKSVVDYLDESDEKFEDWYKNLQEKM